MYTSLSIKNFRAFETLEIEGLKRVNLFTGRNNSGKTSVLEAVYLLEGEFPASRARQLFSNRNLAGAAIQHQTALEMPWATLFRDLSVETDIRIEGINSGASVEIRLSTQLDEKVKSHFGSHEFSPSPYTRNLLAGHVNRQLSDMIWINEGKIESFKGDASFLNLLSFVLSNTRRSQQDLVTQFGRLEVVKLDGLVVEALQIVDPRLRNLSTILLGGVAILHADLDGTARRLPLAVVGDGMLRFLDIIFAIVQNSGRAVMIDEIENGFHYSTLPKVWELIHKLAKQYNVQIFAVTNSQECAVAAHEAAKADGYDYQYFRIEQKEGIGRAVPFDEEIMQTAIDAELEFR